MISTQIAEKKNLTNILYNKSYIFERNHLF